MSAVFAVLALRSTGIGFLMITLALGQILWGIAYRWVSLTNGDNGIKASTRPMVRVIGRLGALVQARATAEVSGKLVLEAELVLSGDQPIDG